MPKQIHQHELEAIIENVAKFPDGASLSNLMKILSVPLSRRNLQYRLLFLVKKGLLHAKGKARARIYQLPSEKKEEIETFKVQAAHLISLSTESEDIHKLVSRPIQMRNPVGYNIQFLDEYRPNVTYYLPPSIRERLFEMGKTDGEQPAGTYARKFLVVFSLISNGIQVVWKATLILYWRQSVFLN